MVGIGRGSEIIGDANSGQLQILDTLLSELFRSAFWLLAGKRLLAFGGGFDDLRFNVFAFPTSRHTYSLTQFAAIGSF